MTYIQFNFAGLNPFQGWSQHIDKPTTAHKLVVSMCYANLNRQIQEQIARDEPRHRLLRYALDQHYLPDAVYQAFAHPQQPGEIPWVAALYWMRRYFEHGDGNNHREQLRTVFRGPQNQFEDLVNSIFDTCGFPLDDWNVKPRQRFLSECFVVGSQGRTSEIWKFLVPLYRRIESAATDAYNWGLLRNFADTEGGDLPPFFQWLIDTEDADFLAMLKAMGTQDAQAEPWLERILASPNYLALWATNSATVTWAVYQNGNVCDLRLVVRNIQIRNGQGTCEIRQGAAVLIKQLQPNQSMVTFSAQELVQSGLHIFETVQVKVGNHRVPGGARLGYGAIGCPVLFRFPLAATSYYSQVTVDAEHISAKRLLALLPEGSDVGNACFFLGAEPWPVQGFKVFNLHGQTRHLVELNLHAWDGATCDLNWGQQLLVSLGTQPYLEVAQALSGVQIKGTVDTALVLGDIAEVSVKNCPNNADVQWSMDDNPAGNGATCQVQRGNSQEARIRCRIAGRTRSVTIVFVPNDAENWIRGAQMHVADGWNWQPETAIGPRIEAAQDGRQEGTLAFQNLNWRVSVPLTQPLWYWQEGIQRVTGVNECKDFANWGEVVRWALYVCLPPQGCPIALSLRLDGAPGQVPLRTLDPGEAFPIHLSYDCEPHLAFDNLANGGFAHLSLGQVELAHVLNVPTKPVLIRNRHGQPCVFFPAGYNPTQYSILVLRESSLVTGALQIIRCDGFPVGGLRAIPVNPAPNPCEGVWVALISQTPDQVPPNLLLLAWHCRQGNGTRPGLLQIAAPGGGSLRARLEGWHGPLNDQQVGMVRNCLDMLDGGFAIHPESPFAAAIRDRAELHIPPGWWRDNFIQQCRLNSLEATLSQALRNGYNWCSEPGLLGRAYNQVRDNVQGNWTENKRQELAEKCPAIAAQVLIEHGFPLVGARRGQIVTAVTGKRFRSWEWRDQALQGLMGILTRQQGGQLLRLRTHQFHTDGCGIRAVSENGILLVGDRNQHKRVIFDARERPMVCFGPQAFHFDVGVNNENQYLAAFTDTIPAHDHHILADAAGQQAMQALFTNCLLSARSLVGIDGDGEYGLARMFSLSNTGFGEMAQDDSAQVNRAVLFQAAVLSRLHARLGLAPSYPVGWPLSQPQHYQQVCSVIREAWFCDHCRQALMCDLIPVEWMITWFHF